MRHVVNPPDYYKILQVDSEAEPEVITAAYRRLAAKYHPDVNPAADALERMRQLNEAYAVIGDSGKRTQYDRSRGATRKSSRARTSYYATRKATPTVVVSPANLAFGSMAKNTAKTLILDISMTEGRTLIGDIHVSHPWIKVSTTRLFHASSKVRVEVDTTGLRENASHSGAVTIDSVSYGVRTIPVAVFVEPVAKPVLLVTPSVLDFGLAVPGRAPKVLSVRLTNGGAGVLTGSITCHQKWLSISQGTWSGNQSVVQAIVNSSGLKVGKVYEGDIEIVSNGGRMMLLARVTTGLGDAELEAAPPVPTRDLDFLAQRMLILDDLPNTTSAQESERLVIGYLMDKCRGGDVALMLQRAIEGAQGWRDQIWLSEGTPLSVNLLPVLTDLFQRLRRWETDEG